MGIYVVLPKRVCTGFVALLAGESFLVTAAHCKEKTGVGRAKGRDGNIVELGFSDKEAFMEVPGYDIGLITLRHKDNKKAIENLVSVEIPEGPLLASTLISDGFDWSTQKGNHTDDPKHSNLEQTASCKPEVLSCPGETAASHWKQKVGFPNCKATFLYASLVSGDCLTEGRSGSAVLSGKGELVGVLALRSGSSAAFAPVFKTLKPEGYASLADFVNKCVADPKCLPILPPPLLPR